MERRMPHSLAIGLALALIAGCASMPAPKSISQGDITPQRKKRAEKATQHFEQQRDFAEYEAAKARWVNQRDPQGCRDQLEKLLARRPQHQEARLLMAELMLEQGNPQVAYDHAKAALDVDPNSGQVQYTMALVFDAEGKTSEALGYYERAARMDPKNTTFAAAYQAARDTEHGGNRSNSANATAIADSINALDAEGLPTGHTVASASTGSEGVGGSASGSADIAGSVGISADDPSVALFRRGQAALSEGSPETALESFRRSAAAKPDNPQIPISAAAAALRAKQPDVAVNLLVPASKQFPQSAAIHRMLGAAYYRTGDYKSSQVALQQAVSLDKSSALSYLLMGYTLAKLGQAESAEAHFREARALDPRYKVVR